MASIPVPRMLLPCMSISMFLLFPLLLSAQKPAFRFDKISPADFNRPSGCDTSAEAIIIADIGSTRFDYGTKGFYLIFERKTRILILKPGGTDHATVMIPLYKNESDREKVKYFKGATFNLVNGEVEKTKVRNEDIFLEEESQHWFRQKVAMPAAKPGSIVEYEYEVNSDFLFNLQPWTFQAMIPVLVSEYTVTIPEYFNYKTLSTGSLSFAVNESYPTHTRFEVHIESQLGVGTGAAPRTSARTEVYDPLATAYHWVARDLPAFKQEPYMTTPKDFLLGTEFELSTLHFPEKSIENVMGNWETINDKLMQDANFGSTSRRGGFISDQLPGILSGATQALDKVRAIYEATRRQVKWNSEYGIYAGNPPRKPWESGTGSVADINLMLTAILNEAGLNADPVILSTRSHGRIIEMYPILANFNYVVACVTIDSVGYLLDATSRVIPFNTLPERCLNGNGRIISRNRPGWIHLQGRESRKDFITATLTLTADGGLTGTCTLSSGGIQANDRRNAAAETSEKDLLKAFTDRSPNWIASHVTLENLENPEKPFNETYTISMPSGVQAAGDHIYFNALLDLGRTRNPFLREKREFPVDFGCPLNETALITVNLPEGWSVEELPKQAQVTLPDKGGSFRFRTQQSANSIQINSTLAVIKNSFPPEEYDLLRELFRLATAKHLEQVVLKKSP
ncbi:MAG TPA: DUF3857 domain-containing protein [Bacteroidales bacterium]|nr:DUF3857 domain-containing protein [Bacteroidales bacterium]